VCSNLLWALSLLGEVTLPAWQLLLGQVAASLLRRDGSRPGSGTAAAKQLPQEALTQLHQSYMLLRLRYSERQLLDAAAAAHAALPSLAPAAASGRLGEVVSEVLAAARSTWLRSVADTYVSDFHKVGGGPRGRCIWGLQRRHLPCPAQ
jgi:hypothetical protein